MDEYFIYRIRKWYKEVFEELEYDKREDYVSIRFKKDKLTYLTETMWVEVTDKVLTEYIIPTYEMDLDNEMDYGIYLDIENMLVNEEKMINRVMNAKMKKSLIN